MPAKDAMVRQGLGLASSAHTASCETKHCCYFHACVFELVPFSLAVVDSCCVLAWSRVNGTRACLNGYSMWMHDLVFIAGASLDVA